jgi:Flp pilus assembly protein TadB
VSYALKLAGAMIALLLAGVLAIVIFENVWLRVGLGAAFLIVCGGLLLVAWRMDRKGRQARAGIEDLPNI